MDHTTNTKEIERLIDEICVEQRRGSHRAYKGVENGPAGFGQH